MWAYHQDERVILIIGQGINRDGNRGINEVIKGEKKAFLFL
ncbi:hypothetical protein HpCK35_31870 [Helicobacter pylori]